MSEEVKKISESFNRWLIAAGLPMVDGYKLDLEIAFNQGFHAGYSKGRADATRKETTYEEEARR